MGKKKKPSSKKKKHPSRKRSGATAKSRADRDKADEQEKPVPAPLPESTRFGWAGFFLAIAAALAIFSPEPISITIAVLLGLTAPVWWNLAKLPPIAPPRIGRPVSKLSVIFLLGALVLAAIKRLPASEHTIIALGTIFLLWRMLHWFGYRCAGLFAAFYFAIHPGAVWAHGRDEEALCLLAIPMAIAAAYLALRTLKWRWWVVYALSSVTAFYSNIASLRVTIGITLFLGLYLVRRALQPKTRAAANPQLVRFLVSTLAITIGVIQLYSYFAERLPEIDLKERFGVPESVFSMGGLIGFVVPILLLLIGSWKLWSGNRYAAPIVLGGLVVSIFLPVVWPKAAIIYLLPVLILPISIGITSLSEHITDKANRPYLTFAIGAVYLLLFAFVGP